VLGEAGCPIPLPRSQLSASPSDLNEGSSTGGDPRTLDKLVDGFNVTTDDMHMWLVPFSAGQPHRLTITLPAPVRISGIRFWNYNKSLDDTGRGAKLCHATLDGQPLSPPGGWFLRKALGHARFDAGQTLPMVCGSATVPSRPAPAAQGSTTVASGGPAPLMPWYVVPVEPAALHYELRFLTTCGDPYYIGLNGLALLDPMGRPLPLTAGQNVFAVPSSVNDLPDSTGGDPRTLDKLFDGVNVTSDDRHMWLAPFVAGKGVVLDILFDTPATLGALLIWNYTKTPARGVRQVQLLLDGRLMFDGFLPPASATRFGKDGGGVGFFVFYH
jgi:hypothetical protein